MWVTRLTVENWRNFTKVNAPLQKRTFLVGPNAAGKSNLLDVFRFLHDLVAVGGGFQEAVRRRGGVSSLRALSARRYPDIAISCQIGNDTIPWTWEYTLRFNQDNRQRPIIKKETVVFQRNKILLDRPNSEDKTDPDRLSQTHLEQVTTNRSYRGVADFLTSVKYLHLVPQLVREPDRSVGKKNDPFGGDFLEQVARTPKKTRNARLRRIRDALRIAVPQLQELDLYRDEARGIPHLRGKYEHWRSRGAWQTEELFSDGTLRLLGLLWAIQDGTGPLLLEEPELSLHPEVVRFVPALFYRAQRRTGRQIIVSTQSSELLKDRSIGLDEVLLLLPKKEGTEVTLAKEIDEAEELLQGGSNLSDIIMARTRPSRAEQLSLFEFIK